MKQSRVHSNPSRGRRRFIGNTIKLIALATIVSPFEQACKNKSKNLRRKQVIQRLKAKRIQ